MLNSSFKLKKITLICPEKTSDHHQSCYNSSWGGHEYVHTVNDNPSKSCWNISLKNTKVNLMGALEENVKDLQSH